MTQAAFTYEGEALRALTLPLGGIGTGSVALAGDGGLRQWQIVNNVNHDAHVPHSFFAVWAGSTAVGRQAAVVLQSAALYDDDAFQPAPMVSDHLVPEASRRLRDEMPGSDSAGTITRYPMVSADATASLGAFPGVDSLEITAQYPVVEVAYKSRALPVQIGLEAFNPFIPLDSKDSGLPAILFNFTVHNPNEHPLQVALMGTQQNLVGWDGKSHIAGVCNAGYGGNVNTLVHLNGVTALDMSNPRLKSDDPVNGNVTLAVFTRPGDEVTSVPQWQAPREVWDRFKNRPGRLPNQGSVGASPPGQTWNGALAAHIALAPGASRTLTFVLAWYFPNRYVTWDQSWLGGPDRKSRFWLGQQYASRFGGVMEVVEYVRNHIDRLSAQTRLYRDRFFASSLPWQLLDAVAGPVSTIRSPTCLWAEDGRFHAFEGCTGASVVYDRLEGSCPLNCTHVWNYEMALSRLFPDLERSMRRTDLVDQMSPAGVIPHRTLLPLYLPRPWDRRIGLNPAVDGELGTVLKTYREVRHGADQTWFDEMWPRVKRLMQHIMVDYDSEDDGVISGSQQNTYDCVLFGPNTFIGSLYLAALRAAEEMAKLRDEQELAARYRGRFEKGRENYDRLCWNGEYYIQVVDLEEHPRDQFGTGCHIDQLLGQWWAYILDLGYVLPREHVRQAAQSIFRYNRRVGPAKTDQWPRIYLDERDTGLFIFTWPHGGRPAVPTNYGEEVWTGLEYTLAGVLLYEGLTEMALTVLSDIRARHDGTRRSPWNEIEAGDHYVRAMASWVLLDAASGFRYDAVHRSLAFAPQINATDFRTFFITGSGWGVFSQNGSTAQLKVDYGHIDLSEWSLSSLAAGARVELNDEPLPVDIAPADGTLRLQFQPPVRVRAGESLTARFSDP